MAKAPVLGLVKTRLGREMGPAAATRFYRATAHALVRRLKRDPRFDITLAVAPDAARLTRALPAGCKRISQGGGDLGARMQRLLEHGPARPVVLVGTDIPGIRATHLATAFRRLGSADVVLGPAADGGFWLVGFRRFPGTPAPFGGVRWSQPGTLCEVEANLAGWRVARGDVLADVDSAADLHSLAAISGRCVLPAV